MGRWLRNASCEACGSSDARAVYDNGTSWCFSCETYSGDQSVEGREPGSWDATSPGKGRGLISGDVLPLTSRGLSAETCGKFGYTCGEGVQIANYHDSKGRLCAQKLRRPDKSFVWIGSPKDARLFGQQLWNAGGKRIVITEGELDAMSVSQVQGNSWPVVSLRNGAASARKELLQELEYLEAFDAVVLLFDMDEAGQRAVAQCADLFTPGKLKVGQLPLKDANAMLQAGRVKELYSATYQARSYQPDGLIEGADLWNEVIRDPELGLSYPWPLLDVVLCGQRLRELVCWTGGTGNGKTQLVRELAFDLACRHGQRVGYISLEESTRSVGLGQIALAMNKRLHLPQVKASVTEEQMREAFDATLGSGKYLFCDPKWVRPEEILSRVRYMVLGLGCRWILLDHISMTVGADASSGDERKRIDELMYKLRSLVDELGFGLHFVTHLRKAGGTPFEEGGKVHLADFRSSGAIAQVANIAIAAERNQQADDPLERNTLTIRVLKNRFSGETGASGELFFDGETGRIVERERAQIDATPMGDF